MNIATTLWRAGCCALLVAVAATGIGPADAGVIDKLRESKTLRIAYRDDAPPFSFKNATGEPAGFMVELCRAVSRQIASDLKLGEIKTAYVPVTATSRFDAIEKGDADLLCEPTSATLSRRQRVDFSIPTVVDGTSLLIRADGPRDFRDFAGKKIGVLAGTTTEQALNDNLKAAGITADVVPAKTHAEGLAQLEEGKVSAYFGDRAILLYLAAGAKAPDKLRIAENYLSVEPYALALPRGDGDFRLAVDRALSRIYRSGDIAAIFTRSFAGTAGPTDILQTLYLISSLPE